MENLEELYGALEKADAAGDTEAARELADYIRTVEKRSASVPKPPAEKAPPGRGEALGRGASQGVTLSFGEEAQAAVGAVTDVIPRVMNPIQTIAETVAGPGTLTENISETLAKIAANPLEGNVPLGGQTLGERYRGYRDLERVQNKEAEAAHPGTYLTGELTAGAFAPVPGVGPVAAGAGKVAAKLGAPAVVQTLAKGIAGGAAVGGGAALGASEAELSPDQITKESVSQALQEIEEGTKFGAKVGAVLSPLALLIKHGVQSYQAAKAARAGKLQDAATKAGEVEAADTATAARARADYERKLRNEAGAAQRAQEIEGAETRNVAVRERAGQETEKARATHEDELAAYEEAKAATKTEQEAAQARAEAAVREPTPDKAVLLARLEGKAKVAGGAERNLERARALYETPVPTEDLSASVYPRQSLLLENVEPVLAAEAVEGAAPRYAARVEASEKSLQGAERLRQAAGQRLSALLSQELEGTGATIPVADIITPLGRELGDWPSQARQNAAEWVAENIQGRAGETGALTPAALGALIRDLSEQGFASPNLEATLGNRAKQLFRAARRLAVLAAERAFEEHLPEALPVYRDLRRLAGTAKDLERGARVGLERATSRQEPIKFPKAEKIPTEEIPPPPGAPKAVEPALEPVPESFAPEKAPVAGTPSPDEVARIDTLRKEVTAAAKPSFRDNMAKASIVALGSAGGVAAGFPLAGYPGAVAGGTVGTAYGLELARNWIRKVEPTAASLGAEAARLQIKRLQPLMEKWGPSVQKALTGSPAQVRVLHTLLKERDPAYKAAMDLRAPAAEEPEATESEEPTRSDERTELLPWERRKGAVPHLAALRTAEQKYELPRGLLSRVAFQESYFRSDIIEGRTASEAGAKGMMQFMPDTAREFGIDPLDTPAAIDAAARYLVKLHQQFGSWPAALAAYNWGPGNLRRKGMERAPRETRNYVREISQDVGL